MTLVGSASVQLIFYGWTMQNLENWINILEIDIDQHVCHGLGRMPQGVGAQ